VTSAPTTGRGSTACWCCGETRTDDQLVGLRCHPEVALCDTCVGWLDQERAGRANQALRHATPILATTDLTRALDHYRALGFEAEGWEGGGYGFLHRDGVEFHLGEVDTLEPTTNTVSLYLFVADADQLHNEWAAASVDGRLDAPTDTDYGLREGRHIDPDGNVIRFGSPLADPQPDGDESVTLAGDDPLAVTATRAVQAGDLDGLERLLRDHPELATARIGDETMSRTLLHAATDWPGHHPNVRDVIGLLVRAGADVNARFHGSHAETPLHWAASSDDIDALDALVDAGADIEASGAVLGGGTPLADACGFGQWQAARRLVERGATTRLKDAAALGLLDRIEAAFTDEPTPTPHDVTLAFWSACHGGQRQAAAYLLDRGADLNWIGWDDLTPLDAATQAEAIELVDWLRSKGAKTASELTA
jgi:uncharacterized protein